MTPDELLSLEDNPNYIEGIYNYCDRWCESSESIDQLEPGE